MATRNIAQQYGFYDYPGKTTNVDLFGDTTYFWLTDIPFATAPTSPVPAGPVTNNVPIDVIHWSASGSITPNTWTNRCLYLLTHL